jgi:Zn-dependent protease with chaperone function
MHTQTESVKHRRASASSVLAVVTAFTLYLLTLTGEVVLGASVRWVLVYLGAAIAGAFVPLGLSAEALAWAAAVAPLAYSVLGLVLPGQGRRWHRSVGARRPTVEEAGAIEDALGELRSVKSSRSGPTNFYVLDELLPVAAVRGHTVIVSRGLVESESLAPVLAHELGHVDSLDGPLTEALVRLILWRDPLAPVPPEHGQDYMDKPGAKGGLLLGLARWALRLAGGSVTQQLLKPLWAAHWRAREYAADAYAASLGQAEELARHLTEQELPFDGPHRRFLFDCSEHPPAARRVERLLAILEETGSQ